MKLLARFGLVEELQIFSDQNVLVLKKILNLSHPARNLPTTNSTRFLNTSALEVYTFSCLKSMKIFNILLVLEIVKSMLVNTQGGLTNANGARVDWQGELITK